MSLNRGYSVKLLIIRMVIRRMFKSLLRILSARKGKSMNQIPPLATTHRENHAQGNAQTRGLGDGCKCAKG